MRSNLSETFAPPSTMVKSSFDSLNTLLAEVKGVFFKVNMDYLFFKAEVDVLKYLYEKEIADSKHHEKDEEHHDDKHHNIKSFESLFK